MLTRRSKCKYGVISGSYCEQPRKISRVVDDGGKEKEKRLLFEICQLKEKRCLLNQFYKPFQSMLCNLENIICKFWWRSLKTNKGIHWCSWASLCIPKVQGGPGFKDLSFFNNALLAKQGVKVNHQSHKFTHASNEI
ncbi:RNA-directed DNA polymerase reverse transcriptase family protein [Gossypium australe]|uniref:RNA-directed DNA polymerase reverse transcriptase family protein n=1 Tax=Gossypium australe TaxID=47621 RepID=A0A5B6VU01_9ROSI|nr:RNA-directed DNA polymerase reverse transcriptase family protein [Gossypium australe]